MATTLTRKRTLKRTAPLPPPPQQQQTNTTAAATELMGASKQLIGDGRTVAVANSIQRQRPRWRQAVSREQSEEEEAGEAKGRRMSLRLSSSSKVATGGAGSLTLDNSSSSSSSSSSSGCWSSSIETSSIESSSHKANPMEAAACVKLPHSLEQQQKQQRKSGSRTPSSCLESNIKQKQQQRTVENKSSSNIGKRVEENSNEATSAAVTTTTSAAASGEESLLASSACKITSSSSSSSNTRANKQRQEQLKKLLFQEAGSNNSEMSQFSPFTLEKYLTTSSTATAADMNFSQVTAKVAATSYNTTGRSRLSSTTTTAGQLSKRSKADSSSWAANTSYTLKSLPAKPALAPARSQVKSIAGRSANQLDVEWISREVEAVVLGPTAATAQFKQSSAAKLTLKSSAAAESTHLDATAEKSMAARQARVGGSGTVLVQQSKRRHGTNRRNRRRSERAIGEAGLGVLLASAAEQCCFCCQYCANSNSENNNNMNNGDKHEYLIERTNAGAVWAAPELLLQLAKQQQQQLHLNNVGGDANNGVVQESPLASKKASDKQQRGESMGQQLFRRATIMMGVRSQRHPQVGAAAAAAHFASSSASSSSTTDLMEPKCPQPQQQINARPSIYNTYCGQQAGGRRRAIGRQRTPLIQYQVDNGGTGVKASSSLLAAFQVPTLRRSLPVPPPVVPLYKEQSLLSNRGQGLGVNMMIESSENSSCSQDTNDEKKTTAAAAGGEMSLAGSNDDSLLSSMNQNNNKSKSNDAHGSHDIGDLHLSPSSPVQFTSSIGDDDDAIDEKVRFYCDNWDKLCCDLPTTSDDCVKKAQAGARAARQRSLALGGSVRSAAISCVNISSCNNDEKNYSSALVAVKGFIASGNVSGFGGGSDDNSSERHIIGATLAKASSLKNLAATKEEEHDFNLLPPRSPPDDCDGTTKVAKHQQEQEQSVSSSSNNAQVEGRGFVRRTGRLLEKLKQTLWNGFSTPSESIKPLPLSTTTTTSVSSSSGSGAACLSTHHRGDNLVLDTNGVSDDSDSTKLEAQKSSFSCDDDDDWLKAAEQEDDGDYVKVQVEVFGFEKSSYGIWTSSGGGKEVSERANENNESLNSLPKVKEKQQQQSQHFKSQTTQPTPAPIYDTPEFNAHRRVKSQSNRLVHSVVRPANPPPPPPVPKPAPPLPLTRSNVQQHAPLLPSNAKTTTTTESNASNCITVGEKNDALTSRSRENSSTLLTRPPLHSTHFSHAQVMKECYEEEESCSSRSSSIQRAEALEVAAEAAAGAARDCDCARANCCRWCASNTNEESDAKQQQFDECNFGNVIVAGCCVEKQTPWAPSAAAPTSAVAVSAAANEEKQKTNNSRSSSNKNEDKRKENQEENNRRIKRRTTENNHNNHNNNNNNNSTIDDESKTTIEATTSTTSISTSSQLLCKHANNNDNYDEQHDEKQHVSLFWSNQEQKDASNNAEAAVTNGRRISSSKRRLEGKNCSLKEINGGQGPKQQSRNSIDRSVTCLLASDKGIVVEEEEGEHKDDDYYLFGKNKNETESESQAIRQHQDQHKHCKCSTTTNSSSDNSYIEKGRIIRKKAVRWASESDNSIINFNLNEATSTTTTNLEHDPELTVPLSSYDTDDENGLRKLGKTCIFTNIDAFHETIGELKSSKNVHYDIKKNENLKQTANHKNNYSTIQGQQSSLLNCSNPSAKSDVISTSKLKTSNSQNIEGTFCPLKKGKTNPETTIRNLSSLTEVAPNLVIWRNQAEQEQEESVKPNKCNNYERGGKQKPTETNNFLLETTNTTMGARQSVEKSVMGFAEANCHHENGAASNHRVSCAGSDGVDEHISLNVCKNSSAAIIGGGQAAKDVRTQKANNKSSDSSGSSSIKCSAKKTRSKLEGQQQHKRHSQIHHTEKQSSTTTTRAHSNETTTTATTTNATPNPLTSSSTLPSPPVPLTSSNNKEFSTTRFIYCPKLSHTKKRSPTTRTTTTGPKQESPASKTNHTGINLNNNNNNKQSNNETGEEYKNNNNKHGSSGKQNPPTTRKPSSSSCSLSSSTSSSGGTNRLLGDVGSSLVKFVSKSSSIAATSTGGGGQNHHQSSTSTTVSKLSRTFGSNKNSGLKGTITFATESKTKQATEISQQAVSAAKFVEESLEKRKKSLQNADVFIYPTRYKEIIECSHCLRDNRICSCNNNLEQQDQETTDDNNGLTVSLTTMYTAPIRGSKNSNGLQTVEEEENTVEAACNATSSSSSGILSSKSTTRDHHNSNLPRSTSAFNHNNNHDQLSTSSTSRKVLEKRSLGCNDERHELTSHHYEDAAVAVQNLSEVPIGDFRIDVAQNPFVHEKSVLNDQKTDDQLFLSSPTNAALSNHQTKPLVKVPHSNELAEFGKPVAELSEIIPLSRRPLTTPTTTAHQWLDTNATTITTIVSAAKPPNNASVVSEQTAKGKTQTEPSSLNTSNLNKLISSSTRATAPGSDEALVSSLISPSATMNDAPAPINIGLVKGSPPGGASEAPAANSTVEEEESAAAGSVHHQHMSEWGEDSSSSSSWPLSSGAAGAGGKETQTAVAHSYEFDNHDKQQQQHIHYHFTTLNHCNNNKQDIFYYSPSLQLLNYSSKQTSELESRKNDSFQFTSSNHNERNEENYVENDNKQEETERRDAEADITAITIDSSYEKNKVWKQELIAEKFTTSSPESTITSDDVDDPIINSKFETSTSNQDKNNININYSSSTLDSNNNNGCAIAPLLHETIEFADVESCSKQQNQAEVVRSKHQFIYDTNHRQHTSKIDIGGDGIKITSTSIRIGCQLTPIEQQVLTNHSTNDQYNSKIASSQLIHTSIVPIQSLSSRRRKTVCKLSRQAIHEDEDDVDDDRESNVDNYLNGTVSSPLTNHRILLSNPIKIDGGAGGGVLKEISEVASTSTDVLEYSPILTSVRDYIQTINTELKAQTSSSNEEQLTITTTTSTSTNLPNEVVDNLIIESPTVEQQLQTNNTLTVCGGNEVIKQTTVGGTTIIQNVPFKSGELESPKKSIFDGASKDEILEYLEDARERVPEILMAADDVMLINENELIVVNQLEPGSPATPIQIIEEDELIEVGRTKTTALCVTTEVGDPMIGGVTPSPTDPEQLRKHFQHHHLYQAESATSQFSSSPTNETIDDDTGIISDQTQSGLNSKLESACNSIDLANSTQAQIVDTDLVPSVETTQPFLTGSPSGIILYKSEFKGQAEAIRSDSLLEPSQELPRGQDADKYYNIEPSTGDKIVDEQVVMSSVDVSDATTKSFLHHDELQANLPSSQNLFDRMNEDPVRTSSCVSKTSSNTSRVGDLVLASHNNILPLDHNAAFVSNCSIFPNRRNSISDSSIRRIRNSNGQIINLQQLRYSNRDSVSTSSSSPPSSTSPSSSASSNQTSGNCSAASFYASSPLSCSSPLLGLVASSHTPNSHIRSHNNTHANNNTTCNRVDTSHTSIISNTTSLFPIFQKSHQHSDLYQDNNNNINNTNTTYSSQLLETLVKEVKNNTAKNGSSTDGSFATLQTKNITTTWDNNTTHSTLLSQRTDETLYRSEIIPVSPTSELSETGLIHLTKTQTATTECEEVVLKEKEDSGRDTQKFLKHSDNPITPNITDIDSGGLELLSLTSQLGGPKPLLPLHNPSSTVLDKSEFNLNELNTPPKAKCVLAKYAQPSTTNQFSSSSNIMTRTYHGHYATASRLNNYFMNRYPLSNTSESTIEFQCLDCDQFIDVDHATMLSKKNELRLLRETDSVNHPSLDSVVIGGGGGGLNETHSDSKLLTPDQLDRAYIAAMNGLPLCKSCEKKRTERKEIISEFIETELKYGRDLKIIQDEFFRPLRVAGLLGKDQIQGVFLNLEELLMANNRFSERLQVAIGEAHAMGDTDFNTISIGRIFVESAEMLHSFESYCIRQGPAACLLARLAKEKELLRIFLRVSQMENTLLRRMNLAAFLMVPVQRVTKYPLLLNRLYKVTPYHHKDREALRDAQLKVELHLEHINQQTKGVGATNKIWRRISNLSTPMSKPRALINADDIGYIKLRKTAMDMLKWDRDETQFIHSGKLNFAPLNEYLIKQKMKPLRYMAAHALLVVLGKPNWKYRPDLVKSNLDSKLMNPTPGGNGIKETALLLFREKNGRFVPCREPLFLSNCVFSVDCSVFNCELPLNPSSSNHHTSSQPSLKSSSNSSSLNSSNSSHPSSASGGGGPITNASNNTTAVMVKNQTAGFQSSHNSQNGTSTGGGHVNGGLSGGGKAFSMTSEGSRDGSMESNNIVSSSEHSFSMMTSHSTQNNRQSAASLRGSMTETNIESIRINSMSGDTVSLSSLKSLPEEHGLVSSSPPINICHTSRSYSLASALPKTIPTTTTSTTGSAVNLHKSSSSGTNNSSNLTILNQLMTKVNGYHKQVTTSNQKGAAAYAAALSMDHQTSKSFSNSYTINTSGIVLGGGGGGGSTSNSTKSLTTKQTITSHQAAQQIVSADVQQAVAAITDQPQTISSNRQLTTLMNSTNQQHSNNNNYNTGPVLATSATNCVKESSSHQQHYHDYHNHHQPYGDYEESFELHERITKESMLLRGDTPLKTRYWLNMLRYHSKDLGQWRHRRHGLANIMMMIRPE